MRLWVIIKNRNGNISSLCRRSRFQVRHCSRYWSPRSTANTIIHHIMNSIVKKSPNWIHFSATVTGNVNEEKVLGQRSFQMLTVISSLLLIALILKYLNQDKYINQKGYGSINVQATCNALEQLTSARAERPGRLHDGRLWRRSSVRRIVSQYDGEVCLLVDSGYGIPVDSCLITPFKPACN